MKYLLAATALIFTTTAGAEDVAVHIDESMVGIVHRTVLTDVVAPADICNGFEGGRGFVQYMGNANGSVPKAYGCWYKNRADDIIMIGRLLSNSAEYVDDIPMEDFVPLSPNFQAGAAKTR